MSQIDEQRSEQAELSRRQFLRRVGCGVAVVGGLSAAYFGLSNRRNEFSPGEIEQMGADMSGRVVKTAMRLDYKGTVERLESFLTPHSMITPAVSQATVKFDCYTASDPSGRKSYPRLCVLDESAHPVLPEACRLSGGIFDIEGTVGYLGAEKVTELRVRKAVAKAS